MNDVDIETAGMVLAKCAANDPWFPKGGDAIIQAWAEVFAESRLSRDDLLAGVARAYRTEESGFRPLPAAIVRHARAAYFEALRDLPDEQREQMEAVNHALQDMGFTPPDAHRFAKRVALGRKPDVRLTEDQKVELRRRLIERAALESAPRRAPVIPADLSKGA